MFSKDVSGNETINLWGISEQKCDKRELCETKCVRDFSYKL